MVVMAPEVSPALRAVAQGALAAGAVAAGAALGALAARSIFTAVARPTNQPVISQVVGSERTVMADDGVQLHVEIDEADSPLTVVFVHGYALTLETFRFQRAALLGRVKLVFFDQRSHGRSGQGEFDTHHIDQLGRDLGVVIDTVAPTGPLVLVGHSMGGMSVMALADQRPELIANRVFGIALLSTTAGGVHDLHLALPLGLSRAFDVLAPPIAAALAKRKGLVERTRWQDTDLGLLLIRLYSFGSTGTQEGSRFVAHMVSSTPVEAIAEFLPALQEHDKRESLGNLEGVDLLVMVGEKDRLTPPERSTEIVERIPGAEFILVPDSGHMLPLEKYARVNEELLALVERAQRASLEYAAGGVR